jgi:hypothetical protein
MNSKPVLTAAQLATKVSAIAEGLGFTVAPRDSDYGRSSSVLTDPASGARYLLVDPYRYGAQGKFQVRPIWPTPGVGQPHESGRSLGVLDRDASEPSAGLSADRPVDVLVRAIRTRVVEPYAPLYQRALAVLAERQAYADQAARNRAVLAAELGHLAQLNQPDWEQAHLSFRGDGYGRLWSISSNSASLELRALPIELARQVLVLVRNYDAKPAQASDAASADPTNLEGTHHDQ